ncbi:LysE family translocator [Thalassobacter stenotrophicus]|uniref:Homoserine/homoserine lactone efflux protein n=2 Tax=Thalassobacter stenotrophicus TaxID=266809 RepID=A0A0P1EWE8_9RHOB|nr:LysE family translocator [Thalassobacter stenotrophicus]PVZ50091.1 LysE family translocator [Thalassobacter stenotrophicus]CUH59200.1 Homoserine/homoserine lactone efflux protein [Thalassobacter stenotrophicus]SHI95976.1 Threonine/homoserine/homoserine lactone efflux protein [Thalassobacter stenotrophicus DSM 16310]
MPLDLWLAFVVASTVLCIIPGPTVLLVVSYALSQGRKVAVASAGGVALGDLVAMTASLVGLGALVLASATLFTVLKWIGAAYLVYLGVKLFMSAAEATPGAVGAPRSTRPAEIFAHAAAVTALNPKSIAFFIAFVPQFMRPEAPLLPQFIILITTFVAVGFLNALLYALLADRMRVAIARPSVLRVLTRLGGATLVAMGVATAALRRA